MTGTATVERRIDLALMAVAVLLGMLAMSELPIGVFQDDGHYMILARALAHGDGYRYANLPGAPAATHFPPGFPLLLAPLWWAAPRFPQNIMAFKLVNVALMPCAVFGVRELARRHGALSHLWASVFAIACCATVPMLFLNGLLFSETAFVAALCGTLLFVESVVAEGDAPTRRLALAGLCIGALALLRTVGLAVLAAAIIATLTVHRPRHAVWITVGAAVPLAPWLWWTIAHGSAVPAAVSGAYGSYLGWVVDAYRAGGATFALAVLRTNLDGLRILFRLFGLAESPAWAQAFTGIPLVVLCGVGSWRLWPRARIALLTVIPYVALLLIWPFPPDRFLWPLWPVIALALVAGTRHLVTVAPQRQRLLSGAAATALLALFTVWHVRTWPTRNWEGLARVNARIGLASASVAAGMPAGDLVASDMDAIVHLYAARPAVPLLALTAEGHVRTRTDDELALQLQGVLDAYHPRWVLVSVHESLRAAKVLAHRGHLRFAGADSLGVLVYAVVQ